MFSLVKSAYDVRPLDSWIIWYSVRNMYEILWFNVVKFSLTLLDWVVKLGTLLGNLERHFIIFIAKFHVEYRFMILRCVERLFPNPKLSCHIQYTTNADVTSFENMSKVSRVHYTLQYITYIWRASTFVQGIGCDLSPRHWMRPVTEGHLSNEGRRGVAISMIRRNLTWLIDTYMYGQVHVYTHIY